MPVGPFWKGTLKKRDMTIQIWSNNGGLERSNVKETVLAIMKGGVELLAFIN